MNLWTYSCECLCGGSVSFAWSESVRLPLSQLLCGRSLHPQCDSTFSFHVGAACIKATRWWQCCCGQEVPPAAFVPLQWSRSTQWEATVVTPSDFKGGWPQLVICDASATNQRETLDWAFVFSSLCTDILRDEAKPSEILSWIETFLICWLLAGVFKLHHERVWDLRLCQS